MQDIVATAVFALFYLSGGIALAVRAKDWKAVIDVYREDRRDHYAAIADRIMKLYSATVVLSVSLCKLTDYHKLLQCTVEPPIVDPPRKGRCMLDLCIKDTARGPQKSLSL